MQATTIDQSRLKIGATVRVTVDVHTLRKYTLPSRVWCGEVKDVEMWKEEHVKVGRVPAYKIGTVKALKLNAVPVLDTSTNCFKCGVHLETDNSKLFGYCLSCNGVFGIPNWSTFSDEALDDLRTSLPEPFRRLELWVQLDALDVEIIDDAPSDDKPALDWDVRFVLDGNIIIVTCPDADRFAPVVRSVPGYRWDSRFSVWKFNATPQIALNLKQAFEGYRRRGTKDFVALINKAEGQSKAQSIKIRTDLPPIPGMKGGGWQHQRAGYYFLFSILTGTDLTENIDDRNGKD